MPSRREAGPGRRRSATAGPCPTYSWPTSNRPNSAFCRESPRGAQRPAMRFDRIWLNSRLATLDPVQPGLGVIEQGAVAVTDGRITYAGPMPDLPHGWDAADRIDLAGRWITPGLID